MEKNGNSIKPTAMVSLITAACLLGDSMLYVVLPLYWRQFGLDALWQVGILLSANRFARVPLNPLIIWLYARIGRRKCVIAAIILATATTFSYSYFLGFVPLLLARLLWGLSWGLLRMGAYFSILEFASISDRGHHMGVYNGVFRLGSLFGMLGGAFIAELLNPLVTGYIFAGVALLAVPLAFVYIPDTTFKAEGQKFFDSINVIFSNKTVAALIATAFLSSIVYQGIFTSMISYLIGYNEIKLEILLVYGFGAASLSGILQSVRWVWEFFLAPKIGRLSDGGKGRLWLLKNFCLLGALVFFAVSYKLNIYLWLLLVVILQVAGTGVTTLTDTIATDVASANKSAPAVLGAHSLFIDLGSATGPVLGYFLNDLGGVHLPFFAAGICLLLISLLWSNVKNTAVR